MSDSNLPMDFATSMRLALRDTLAESAMNAFITGHMADGSRMSSSDFPKVAMAAYMMADAMLAARAQ